MDKQNKIEEFLTRGVETVIPSPQALRELLLSGKKIRVYNGIDPTATKIHLGHTVPLRKLQQLAEMGHEVTFLIGDLTAFIGDTSDKNTERPQLTEEEIENNWQTYKRQASKFLDFSKVSIVRNSSWLNKLNFTDVIKLTRHFSLNDFISRELIKKRLSEGGSVNLAEVLYPIAQGYDSYYLKTDLQIGGPEQIFNMQAGRTLIKDLENRESFCLSTSILEGTDGRKMSKSWGNAIWVEDSPDEIFGKIMSLKDELIKQYFLLATNLPQEEIPMAGHPMELKKQLAHRIIIELHNKQEADRARDNFERIFQRKELENIETVLPGDLEVLIANGIIKSRSEWKRLIKQGAVERDGVVATDENLVPGTYRIGKRRFVRIV